MDEVSMRSTAKVQMQRIKARCLAQALFLFFLYCGAAYAEGYPGSNPGSAHSLDYCTLNPGPNYIQVFKPPGGALDLEAALIQAGERFAQFASNSAYLYRWNPLIPITTLPGSGGGPYHAFTVDGVLEMVDRSTGAVIGQYPGERGVATCACTDSFNFNLVGIGTDANCYCDANYNWDEAQHTCARECPAGEKWSGQVQACRPVIYVSATPPIQAQCGPTCNGVGDPVNPENGAMYAAEMDLTTQGSSLEFKRFYNSTDSNSSSFGTGWRHSFSRSIKTKYSNSISKLYLVSADNSSLYNDEALACTNGFSQIKGRVSTWASATASYASGVCTLRIGATTIGTLPILYNSSAPAPGTAVIIGFDATRDDGQLVSFILNGSSIIAPPSINLKLEQTGTGYALIDADDSVEIYDMNGKLLSITSRVGVVQTLSYDASSRLSTVIDTFGHTLVLTYDSQGRLDSAVNQ